MKTRLHFFSFFIVAAMFAACVSSESELLKQARSIQDEMLTSVDGLDSTMTARLKTINEERSVMAMDSTMSTDSIKLQSFMILKDKIDNITNIQSEMVNWRSNLKLLPDAKEIAGGAENPFGEKAKDQEILSAIKKSQEEFNNFQIKAEAAMK